LVIAIQNIPNLMVPHVQLDLLR